MSAGHHTQKEAIRAPAVVAHRGAATRYPENTLASAKAVMNMAMCYPKVKTYIEADVRVTADGKAVIMHDATVDATTDGHGDVASLTLAEIQAMKAHKRKGWPSRDEPTLEFEEAKKVQPHLQLHPISDADNRAPSVEEMLELAWQTNQCQKQVGGQPVGLCLELKTRDAVDILAGTINQFAEKHPDAEVPLMLLGIISPVTVQDNHMMDFWQKLSPKAQHYFYAAPDKVTHVIQKEQWLPNGTVVGAIASAASNMRKPFHLIGNPHHSGDDCEVMHENRKRIRANHPSMNTVPEVRHAIENKQDAIWTNIAWETMDVVNERFFQTEKNPPAGAPQPRRGINPAFGIGGFSDAPRTRAGWESGIS